MIASLIPLVLAQAAAAQSAGKTRADALAPSEIVAAAPADAWRAVAARDLLVMDLAPDAAGRPRRVTIQLIPAPFSQGWVDNIRALAAAHWWDGTSVNRVQDNYVVQWGDATEKKPLPAALSKVPEGEYTVSGDRLPRWPHRAGTRDAYAAAVGFAGGFAVAMGSPVAPLRGGKVWPVHCYGMVGVGRNLSPDTGSGAELYTVIGHAPRHLDRNIAVVGRVIEGIEHLSSLPRGSEGLGFYRTAAERTPIVRIRLATELPAAEQPRFEYLSTEADAFARYADARANRRDAFFNVPAGGADICNIPVPVRRAR